MTTSNAPSSKTLNTKIASLAKRMTTWKRDSHDVAMDVMRHSFSLNGAGLDLLMKLYDALGTNGNREQFKRWIDCNFPVVFVKDTFKLNKTEFKRGDDAWCFEQANDMPWYEMDTDGEVKAIEFDMTKLLKMLKSVAKKADKNGLGVQARQIEALADILDNSETTSNEISH